MWNQSALLTGHGALTVVQIMLTVFSYVLIVCITSVQLEQLKIINS